MVGRCVFDRTASMNNTIFHSFLFFSLFVCVHVCVCVSVSTLTGRLIGLVRSLHSRFLLLQAHQQQQQQQLGPRQYISGGVFVVMRLWREALGAAGNWQTRWRGMFGLYS